MIKSTRIENAKFVMSKDELTYAEVIEDFKNASEIHILTYNISRDKSNLLEELKKCTGFDDLELASAIGWLAREDKIQFELRDSDPMHKKAYVYLMLNLYF